jgi:Tfp pilus assembly protein PilN
MRAVNLIPSDQRSGSGSLTGRSGGAALIVLGLIVGVAVLAAIYGGAARQISNESGEVAKLEAQTAEVRARTGRLTPYTAFVAMAEQRTKTVAQLVQARFDWSHTLHELGRVLPSGSALLTLKGTVGGAGPAGSTPAAAVATASATPASSTPPGSVPTISLTGCSTSQAEVAQTLQRLRLIDGVSEVHLVSATKGAVAGGGASGGCGKHVAFSITVTFAALPATPIPNVAAPTVPASTAAAKGAHAEQVSGRTKGARR